MNPTALVSLSAGGAASACSPSSLPTALISPALRCVDIATNASTTSKMIFSKNFLVSPSLSLSSPSSAMVASARTNINNGMIMKICPIKGPHLSSTTPASIMIIGRRRRRSITCEVALRSNNSATSSLSSSSTTVTKGEEEGEEAEKRIGAKVRVKVPLKVYHVPRVPEVDLTGKEGHLKQYVALWKGKRISANLPYKVEFVVGIEGRGPVKFFAHLREDEFDCLE
ncbi:hypothetical protein P3X46_011391 [Hevea brasiliensis]|uniref:Ferredoxin thioredoxin reductase alpha chain domain-containing protein n=1 Tax=Hevea brasiliensis TaxID=3981 RepID=A0ABQ9MJH3_HEVBR|nr:ferredoxin-thioredoxin reductase subunit A2, chloroplastic [Hevea brasiliensis]KAJ9179622.1 hypothetical protein P3X46_011391 [Hevea brasiliensis]